MRLGVQTYTIRQAQKRCLETAYAPLAKMGISDLEIARIHFTRKNALKIAELKDSLGISPVSMQVKPKQVFGDADSVVDFANTVGCKNVVVSMLPFGCILGGEDKFYTFLNSLDEAAKTYEERGITLAYHHHNWEYVRLDSGRTRMDELLLKTKKIKFVTDTYWAARSGADPAKQIRAFGDRLLGIHLRDLSFRPRLLDVIPENTTVGCGVIDFSEVLSAAREVGCEYAVIEQKTSTPYEDIARGYDHVLKIKSQLEENSL
jgi:sugar phosphate isomerase/epimerase